MGLTIYTYALKAFTALTFCQVFLHLFEWGLLIFPRRRTHRNPRLDRVVGFESIYYTIAIFFPVAGCAEDAIFMETRMPVLAFGVVHILGWLSLHTDTLRARLQAAADRATSASSVAEIVPVVNFLQNTVSD